MSTTAIADSDRLGYFTQEQLIKARSLDFVRFLTLRARYINDPSGGSLALRNFSQVYPQSMNLRLFEKAAVAAGTTTDSVWAGPLAPLRQLSDGFLELLRPQTLLGRIPGLRSVPFQVTVPSQTAGGVYSWIGEGNATPATKSDFSTVTLGRSKAGGLIVVTDELAKLSTPAATTVLQRELMKGVAQFLDTQLVDPAIAAVAGLNPASITNGAASNVSAGATQANAATDWQTLISNFVASNPNVEDLVVLSSPANAVALSRALNQPSLGLKGGSAFGIPVITSGSVGNRLIALDASQILIADEGDVEVDVTNQATIQFDSTPANPSDATTVLVSLWSRNLTGFKIVRMVNWMRAATTAVRYISGVAYA